MNPVVIAPDLQGSIPHARWFRIIPPAIIIYIIAYMDRMNIGFAMAGGMNEALGLSMTVSGLSAGIFFIGYVLLQAPAGHIAEHGSAKRYILWTIIAWGVLSFVTGFVQNSWQLLTLRFLLGVAEGGVYPATLVIVGNWFPQKELGRANGLFLCSLPISAIVTNPVSGWIVSNFSWRWLFFAEGIVSLSLIFIWMPLISDRPEDAKWISKEEKEYLVATLAADKAASDIAFKAAGHVKWSYKQLFADKYLWLMIAIFFCFTTSTLGYALWLPTMIKKIMKVSLTNVGWLTSLPFLMSLTGLYVMGALSDKKGNRRFYIVLSMAAFGVCFWIATLFPDHIWLSYGLLVLTGLFQKGMQSPFWSIPSIIFPPGVAGASRGLINGIGNLGGFCGPVLVGWLTTKTGSMTYGIYGLAAVSILGGIITLLLPKITAGYKYKEMA
jgi:MFS family permease